MTSEVQQQNSFSGLLQYWRKKQGLSQLDLALLADVSQRHLSFLESGRSQPTQDMILRLAQALGLSLRTQNQMLSAGGFDPIYTESDLEGPEMQGVRLAIDFLLRQQEPYPAFVLNRYWQVLKSNTAAQELLHLLLGDSLQNPDFCTQGKLNMMILTLHPQGLRTVTANWDELAYVLLQRLQREALRAGQKAPAAALYEQMKGYCEGLQLEPDLQQWGNLPIVPVVFKLAGQELRCFSTLTTLGTPSDITLEELRLEALFPADETSAQLYHGILAGSSTATKRGK